MSKMKWTQVAVMASLSILTSAMATQATVLRAFVSSTGNDANAASNCPQATPCKTFAGALPVVTPGGELIALDTSGYGPLTGGNSITKAITIAAVPGATAFVVAATSTSGFTITGLSTDLIELRNINFNGSGAASTTGITHTLGKLTLQNCGFSQLTTGLSIANSASRAQIKASAFQSNGTGILVTGGKVDISDCLISQNTLGVKADGDGGAQNTPPNGTTLVRVDRGDVTLNTTAFQMANPGLKPGGGINGLNIFLRSPLGVYTTNVIDNTTFLTVTGNASQCGADPCASSNIGTYTGQGL